MVKKEMITWKVALVRLLCKVAKGTMCYWRHGSTQQPLRRRRRQ